MFPHVIIIIPHLKTNKNWKTEKNQYNINLSLFYLNVLLSNGKMYSNLAKFA